MPLTRSMMSSLVSPKEQGELTLYNKLIYVFRLADSVLLPLHMRILGKAQRH